MFSNVGKAEDNQFQTLKNSGTEPTYSRLDGRSFTSRRQVVHASAAGRGRRNTSRDATYA
ncbi:MAG: hypothetical protein ACRC2T_13110 [Thermoguttaceae bacterium]